MAENRDFTAEEIYKRTLHQRRATVLAIIQTLKDELAIWEAELEQAEKDVANAPIN